MTPSERGRKYTAVCAVGCSMGRLAITSHSRMDQTARNRARLFLRAQEAMGLTHITKPKPPAATEAKIELLKVMNENEVRSCVKCRLCQGRNNTVFGEGEADAQIMFIGEGPGETEDRTGRPFVGRAGNLLDKMIAAMGLQRGQVYIANIVKCRPPQNRAPLPDEVATCTPYLLRQIQIIKPKIIVTLGLPATQFILQTNLSMGKLRGIWHTWNDIKVMPTYHPSYVLRSYTPQTRAAVWSDLQKVMAESGLPQKKSSATA